MNNHIICILCNVSGSAEQVNTTLRDDPSGRFKVMRCLTCGHVQLFPLPSHEDDAAFYRVDHQARNQTGKPEFALWQRKTAVDTRRHVDWIRSLLPEGGKVLDIGCGYGFFVDALVQVGYQAIGLDVGEERLAMAKAHLQGTFIQSELSESFVKEHRNRFQVVSVFHVLEHVQKPVSFLKKCYELVEMGGWLLIEIPNLSDKLIEACGEYHDFYWQRAHLSYFDPARLELALRRARFKDFSVRGVQRFGLQNLLHWLNEGKPQLNHPIFNATEPILTHLEQLYRNDRVHARNSDTLIAEVRK